MSDDEKQELQTLITEAVEKAIQSNDGCKSLCCRYCTLTPQTHNAQHEMITDIGIDELYQDHRFVKSVREGKGVAMKAGIIVLVGSFLSFMGAALWLKIIEIIKG